MTRTLLTLTLLALGDSLVLNAASSPPRNVDTTAASKQIDAILAADWKKNQLQPNSASSDEVFVRRVYLDVTGRIPTYRETEEFLNSKSPDKRATLIDQLLAGDGYVQHYFNFWADILRAQSGGNQTGGITGAAYTNFIKDSLRSNKPYDQFVREMVASQGKAWDNGAIGYYMRDRGMPLDNMAATVRIFLGTRVECAQCHNHPFDKWTQKQFYEMAAFTYGVESKDYSNSTMTGVRDLVREREDEMRKKVKAAGGKPTPELQKEMDRLRDEGRHLNEALQRVRDPLRYTSVSFRDKKLLLPHDYKYPDAQPKTAVKAATMMGKPVDCPPDANSMEAYAAWIASPENPRFTNVVANRLWKKIFGMGLIEPVDELMDNTVAMNPELMAYLEKFMISVNYDMKAYLRALLNTQTYQRSVSREEVPAGSSYHFTGPLLRRMSAEQMWDSFVALINPTPDMPNLVAHDAVEKKIGGARKLGDALDALTPEEMLKGAQIASGKYRDQAVRLKEISKEMSEARLKEDNAKISLLKKQSSDLQRDALKSVSDNILLPAVKKLAVNVAGKAQNIPASTSGETADAPGADKSMMMSGVEMETSMSKIQIPGYDKPKKSEAQIKAEQEEQKARLLNEAAYFGISSEKDIKRYITARQQNIKTWVRSAEIESPAPRGHYLREFGQSDRETIENANYDASVPQVLALMNSQLLPQIMDHFSQLMLTINKAKYPDEAVEAAYVTLLSRKPTEKEKRVWLEAQDKGLSTMEDLIYALINTQQFIFIQ